MRIVRLIILAFFAVTAFSTPANPQSPQKQESPPKPKLQFSTSLLSKSVVYISLSVEGTAWPLRGTGFLVSFVDNRIPDGPFFIYLVTNRHVAQAIYEDGEAGCKPHPVKSGFVTLNLKIPVNGNRTKQLTIDANAMSAWQFPEDPGIDLAVLPVAILDAFDVVTIDSRMFLTADLWEKFQIVPGDRILTTGFFRSYVGAHQFQPMVREGTLAMVPDDAMQSTLCKPAKVYLADVHVIAGNSGSPIFVAPKAFLGGLVLPSDGNAPYLLLGVVSGYMYEDSNLTLHPSTDFEATIHANSGITTVVPAEQLNILLNSPFFQRQREGVVQDVLTHKKN